MLGLVGMIERDCGQGGILRRRTNLGREGWSELREAGHDDCYCGGDVSVCVCFSLWEVNSGKRRKTARQRSRVHIHLCMSLVIIYYILHHYTFTSTEH